MCSLRLFAGRYGATGAVQLLRDPTGQRPFTAIASQLAKSDQLPSVLSAYFAVSFLCPSQLDVVRFRQLSQRFSETVHAGLVIVKLL